MNRPDSLPTRRTARILRRRERERRPPPGAAPGVLAPPEDARATKITALSWDGAGLEESGPKDAEAFARLRAEGRTVWVDVQGLADLETVRAVGEAFGLHSLVVSDVIHTHQRPKTELYDEYLVVVLRMPRDGAPHFEHEQLMLVVGEGFVLSFQEWPGDCFEPVRTRLRAGKGRIRTGGADYLAYALIDAVIDSYFPVLERAGERTEDIEDRVVVSPTPELVGDIHVLKRELLDLRRAIWPMREVIGALLRDDVPVIQRDTRVYLRDCGDHAFQLLDMLELYREIAAGLIDLHLSSLSNRLNEVMKVLTVIATIFMPLTFVTGLYGMNFDRASPFNMPELGWRFGYPFALGLMAASAVAMLIWFRRRGWLGGDRRTGRDANDRNGD